MRKNQGSAGSRNGMAKLTREQVEEIKQVYSDGEISMGSLGAKYGVSGATVHRVIHGDTWSASYDSDEEVFWSKVNRNSGIYCATTGTECCIWEAGSFSDGYGAFSLGGKLHRASHWSYQWAYDVELEAGTLLMHSCDHPLCVRYDHLTPGTAAGNSADMVAKGRSAAGERNAAAKLTDTFVSEIRAKHLEGVGKLKLAKEYGVSKPTITRLLRRETWKHVS